MYVDILSHPDVPPHALASLRVASGGGAAMPHAIAQKLKDLYGLDFMEGYGLSETMAPSHTNPPHRAKMQCIGIPLFGVESLIVDPSTMSVLPSGSVGEIVLRAPQLFKGYWNNEEATRESFVEIDGRAWFRTGDLGWVDEDGYFFFADRLKRMINVAGNKVWRGDRQGRRRAPSRCRSDDRRKPHAVGDAEHGRLQGATPDRVRRRATAQRLGQDRLATAAGTGERRPWQRRKTCSILTAR
jgi:hypothetical protein